MERREIRLDYEIKLQLIKILHNGKITPDEADILIPSIDARGKEFDGRNIYSNISTKELVERADAIHKLNQ